MQRGLSELQVMIEAKEIFDLGLRCALERKTDVLCHCEGKEEPGFEPHCRWDAGPVIR